MDRLKTLVREPAILLSLGENLIALLVVLQVPLSHDQQATLFAVLVALIGLAKGVLTHPFAVHFVTDLARAVLVCAVAFGLHMSADDTTVIVTFVGTVVALIGSIRTTPSYDSIVGTRGAGGGPVAGRTERGAIGVLAGLGIALLLAGLLVLLFLHSLILGIVLLVIGGILVAVDHSRGGTYRRTL